MFTIQKLIVFLKVFFSLNFSPFNTNIEIYSATIENTVVSYLSCRLRVHSKKI